MVSTLVWLRKKWTLQRRWEVDFDKFVNGLLILNRSCVVLEVRIAKIPCTLPSSLPTWGCQELPWEGMFREEILAVITAMFGEEQRPQYADLLNAFAIRKSYAHFI